MRALVLGVSFALVTCGPAVSQSMNVQFVAQALRASLPASAVCVNEVPGPYCRYSPVQNAKLNIKLDFGEKISIAAEDSSGTGAIKPMGEMITTFITKFRFSAAQVEGCFIEATQKSVNRSGRDGFSRPDDYMSWEVDVTGTIRNANYVATCRILRMGPRLLVEAYLTLNKNF